MSNMDKIEAALNGLAWHLQVVKESETTPCPVIVARHMREAKMAFDRLDNFGDEENHAIR
tara:strand:- start:312 stop:491 length:180 start_codon:yes stop_codon:yes gene_type:complete